MAVYERSIPTIVTDVLTDFATLLRKESHLARAELSEKLTQLAVGLGLVIAGAVLIMPGLVVLLEAGVAALEKNGWAPHWSALAVGGGALILGLILLGIGVSRFKARNLMPAKTLQQIKEDADVVKRQGRRKHEYQRAA
jgi:NADH:ubiquinone oxidoreductase subunit 6 (subunit J)